MDPTHFNTVTHTLIRFPSRRDVLRGLAGAGLGLGSLRLSDAAEAKNKKSGKKKSKKEKRKQKRSKPNVNQYGCLDVGQPCKGDSTRCCSGVCEGKKPAKGKKDASRCIPHNTGICAASANFCATGNEAVCNGLNASCHCTVTTGNAGFCGQFTVGAPELCRVCSRDTDCQVEFGPGAACVVFDVLCSTYCPATGGTACMPACAI